MVTAMSSVREDPHKPAVEEDDDTDSDTDPEDCSAPSGSSSSSRSPSSSPQSLTLTSPLPPSDSGIDDSTFNTSCRPRTLKQDGTHIVSGRETVCVGFSAAVVIADLS